MSKVRVSEVRVSEECGSEVRGGSKWLYDVSAPNMNLHVRDDRRVTYDPARDAPSARATSRRV